jgi:hypothetical protein
VATCQSCRTPMCTVCRTRWRDQPFCTACVDRSLASPEEVATDPRVHRRQAFWSFLLGLCGWLLLILGALPLVLISGVRKEVAVLALLVVLLSFFPALFAAGQGAAAVRSRGDRLRLATAGLAMSTAQIGLMIGIVLLTVWAY